MTLLGHPDNIGLERLGGRYRDHAGRRDPPTELDWSKAEYIPLPPSPRTWEREGEDELRGALDNSALGPLIIASYRGNHTKVIRLARNLTAEQRLGIVGVEIAKAYRKGVIRRMKAQQFLAAARMCVEMFDLVPLHVNDTDRRRYNRVVRQLDKSGRKHSHTPIAVVKTPPAPLFSLTPDSDWTLGTERRLLDDEKPDPSFRLLSIDRAGTWLADTRGSGTDRDAKSAVRRADRTGKIVAEAQLKHDIYRTGTSPVGSSIAIMDSGGGLHIYNEHIKLVAERNLRDDSRVQDHFRTIDTHYWGDFKSQVRSVDVSPAGDCYLFTLADEAWCCTRSGQTRWGVVMPLKDGWKRVVRKSKRCGPAREVEKALQLFGLSLPIDVAEIKKRYRVLALANHPDRNRNDPGAHEKMKTLNGAFEILTGIDPSSLELSESDKTYFERTRADHVVEMDGFRIEISIDLGSPQDWVYAASFAAENNCTFVATYSGKIILLSDEGHPLVVYDLGTCPSQIIDVGCYTYFLTPTRLYVIEDRSILVAVHDVLQQGRVVVSRSGFGLLQSKSLRWFSPSGTPTGEVKTRDPIRAVFAIEGGAIVQTRQHQVEVLGLDCKLPRS